MEFDLCNDSGELWGLPTSASSSTAITLTTLPEDYWRCVTPPKTGSLKFGIATESFERIWASQIFRDATNVCVPKRILRSGPATIVFWKDGTKTIVKFCAGETEDSAYAAFTAALAIKIFGSNSKLKKIVKTLTEVQK